MDDRKKVTREELLKETMEYIRIILAIFDPPEPICIKCIWHEFKWITGQFIPFKQLGYSSYTDFMKAHYHLYDRFILPKNWLKQYKCNCSVLPVGHHRSANNASFGADPSPNAEFQTGPENRSKSEKEQNSTNMGKYFVRASSTQNDTNKQTVPQRTQKRQSAKRSKTKQSLPADSKQFEITRQPGRWPNRRPNLCLQDFIPMPTICENAMAASPKKIQGRNGLSSFKERETGPSPPGSVLPTVANRSPQNAASQAECKPVRLLKRERIAKKIDSSENRPPPPDSVLPTVANRSPQNAASQAGCKPVRLLKRERIAKKINSSENRPPPPDSVLPTVANRSPQNAASQAEYKPVRLLKRERTARKIDSVPLSEIRDNQNGAKVSQDPSSHKKCKPERLLQGSFIPVALAKTENAENVPPELCAWCKHAVVQQFKGRQRHFSV